MHALPVDRFEDVVVNGVEEFVALLERVLVGRDEREFIGGVIDMFVDDGMGKLEYDEFVKCLRGYHNFMELWWKMRLDYLS